jgi:hypothetical protein
MATVDMGCPVQIAALDYDVSRSRVVKRTDEDRQTDGRTRTMAAGSSMT